VVWNLNNQLIDSSINKITSSNKIEQIQKKKITRTNLKESGGEEGQKVKQRQRTETETESQRRVGLKEKSSALFVCKLKQIIDVLPNFVRKLKQIS
jgi:hypothetical protein